MNMELSLYCEQVIHLVFGIWTGLSDLYIWSTWCTKFLKNYRQTSNLSRTKSQKINISRLVLQLS